MVAWKNGLTTEEVARKVLRSYLVRCHKTIRQDYPEIAEMTPDSGADFLLHLKDTGRIEIKIRASGSSGQTRCEITELTIRNEVEFDDAESL